MNIKKMPGLLLLWLPLAALPNESSCYSIQSADRKNFCLAEAKKQDSYCYSIQDGDIKNFCLGQVKNSSSYCYSIKSQDVRNHCLALLR